MNEKISLQELKTMIESGELKPKDYLFAKSNQLNLTFPIEGFDYKLRFSSMSVHPEINTIHLFENGKTLTFSKVSYVIKRKISKDYGGVLDFYCLRHNGFSGEEIYTVILE